MMNKGIVDIALFMEPDTEGLIISGSQIAITGVGMRPDDPLAERQKEDLLKP